MKIKKDKIGFFSLPSTKILIRYSIIAIISVVLAATILPIILNYPPESINTAFDIEMSGISYTSQFTLICIVSLLILFILVKMLFVPIDNWFKDSNPKKYQDETRIKLVRKKCFNLPYIIFFTELLVPTLGVTFVLLITNSHHFIMILKILIMLLSFLLLFSVLSYIFSKDLYNKLLTDTYKENIDIGFRVNLRKKIIIQILPICILGILLTSLIAYSQSVKSKEDTLFSVYRYNLVSSFDSTRDYSIDEMITILNDFHLYDSSHSKFIIKPNKEVISLTGEKPSTFVVEYTTQISDKYEGKTYDSYGVDTQGATLKISTSDGDYYVGILYSTDSKETLIMLCVDFTALILLIIILLFLFTRSLSKDLSTVSKGLNDIATSDNKHSKLPVISNDEIGDLCISYNKVQEINDKNIEQIKNSQDLLIERERLASLGQMIGGIAHNLKTPIMSISGAAEGIHDLSDELNRSIGNPIVTNEDFHAIAKDIDTWVDKIKVHTAYMSDVITAVKGQAVTFSEDQVFSFTVTELFKQVDILMRHELKSSLVNLNIKNNVSDDVTITGNINSLVQIINNMISNSIQAYNAKPNSNIDLIANLRDNTVVISVKDYGCGLPEEVQEKLFKEMITTKGKSGTGLGLFMSYSNIKAHFQGDITFTSKKNMGTTFNIIIPIKND